MDPSFKIRKQKARKIKKILDRLYPQPAIPLQHSSPYTFLIAVLLSAQCTDARVNQVTPKLFQQAATPQQMLQLDIATIQHFIHSCGLAPRKAKAIWQLSKILLDSYQGEVPRTFEALESLPGVGHKTASVIMSQLFHQAAFPVDTHIQRCAKRWGLSEGKNVLQVEHDLKTLFPQKDWSKLHLQIIYFARQYCPARGHQPANCPICAWCT